MRINEPGSGVGDGSVPRSTEVTPPGSPPPGGELFGAVAERADEPELETAPSGGTNITNDPEVGASAGAPAAVDGEGLAAGNPWGAAGDPVDAVDDETLAGGAPCGAAGDPVNDEMSRPGDPVLPPAEAEDGWEPA
jgi:hypothetical protein